MPSKKGPEGRMVRRVSRQTVIALPPWVCRRLAVGPGVVAYFHRHRGGEVVLTTKEHRGAGQPGRRDLEEELTRITEERDLYKQQALAQDAGSLRAVFGQGYEAALKREIPVTVQLQRIAEQLAELRAYVRPPRRAHRPTDRSRSRDVVVAGSIDEQPSPSPAPSPASVDGGGAGAGGVPQASP
jgi:hypothetical protein